MRLCPSPLLLLGALALAGLAGCGSGSSSSLGSIADPDDPDPTDPTDPVTMTSFVPVDTGQDECFDDVGITADPAQGEPFHGQDAQYEGAAPHYVDNGDGTVSDLVTGLMWQRDPGAKVTFAQATAQVNSFALAGYTDWRLPTIKELYSLIDFRGIDPPPEGTNTSGLTPFIDDRVFAFEYGDLDAGERIIDSQWLTSTLYVADTGMVFGVNFADGRIKGYGLQAPFGGGDKTFFRIHVRGDLGYGVNRFVDNGDGTIRDEATDLVWTQGDSGTFGAGADMDGKLNWEQALAWAENLEFADYDDWRLPNAKELQMIVDYARSPTTTGTAAIDPIFVTTSVDGEDGVQDFGWYWTGTTHIGTGGSGNACYVCFGRSLGYMDGSWQDVHGAGCQRSDPKDGDPSDYPFGHGPQGDAIRIFNLVRCVRDAND